MSKTILLADDSVTIQKVVELTFMDEDYEVVAVSNGDDALARLEEVAPDLVIADVHMPGADGYEVCRQAKAARPDLPVLLLVGTFEPFQPDDAESAGADGSLKKPFDSQELLRTAEQLMAAADAGEATADLAADDDSPFELEASPWDEAAEDDSVEVVPAEGLVSTETVGAGAHDELEDTSAMPVRPSAQDTEVVGAEPSDFDEADAELDAMADEADLEDEIEAELAAETLDAGPEPVDEGPEVEEAPEPASPEVAAAPVAAGNGSPTLSDGDVERVARRVVELLGDRLVREVAWEVVPDLAEVVIRDRIRELERQLE